MQQGAHCSNLFSVLVETQSAALPLTLRDLAAAQCAVVSRKQLRDLGIDRWQIRNQIRARRWRLVGSRVVVLNRGELTNHQRRWVAVLHAGPAAALARRSALEAAGLHGWPATATHVVVARGTRVAPLSGVVVHESRGQLEADIDWRKSPPRSRVERAAIDEACALREPRTACALLAAVVQQRLTTAARLRTTLVTTPRARNRKLLMAVLADIEGGAQALSEIDFVALCRRAGLPPPAQQVVRTDRFGRRRYLDVVWKLPGGRTVVVEIDGAVHLLAATYWDDMARQNELVLSGDIVLRYPSVAIRITQERVIEELRRALLLD